jgi:hypothetical protein
MALFDSCLRTQRVNLTIVSSEVDHWRIAVPYAIILAEAGLTFMALFTAWLRPMC